MEEITLETFDLKPSSDFGGGIEFLMNDKQGQIKKDPSLSLEEELKEFDFLGKDSKPVSMSFEREPISIFAGLYMFIISFKIFCFLLVG